MADAILRSFSTRLRELTSELRALDQNLKANAAASGTSLREFRQALDNIRLTAWTVSELQNAKQTRKDPEAVTSFLTAERLRRFRQMVNDLCTDLEHDGNTWPAESVDDLQDSVNELRERLGLLAQKRSMRGDGK
jgi:hypothetical protein